MGVDLEELPLILDGGNFVTNGEVAIITRRVVTDNKKTEKEIESILKDMLNITPVFVDEMKGEDTGHADGCVAFLSKNDVAVSKYPDDWYEGDREYVDGLAELLESKGFKVHRIMDVLQEPKDKPDGLFVNFLRLNDIILMPTYSHVDKSIIDANMATLSKFGKVIPVACDDLAKFGGVLHCISFTN
jgi:agmatine/peptidylarginine deiminase